MNKKPSNKNNNYNIDISRHSLAHILASAVLDMFPEAKFGVGPNIENGFYYDFDLPRTLIPEDLPILEEKMKKIISANLPFERREISHEEAVIHFNKASQKYKVEILATEAKEPNVTVYKTGNFVDLCRGPHIDSAGEIDSESFELTKIAGAYWRGDEKNKMLQRIYGLAFADKKELAEFLKQQEEAEKRDHRKLGKDLELFDFSEEIGAGLPLWLPKGTIIRDELENWAKETEKNQGYQRVATPHITKSKLFFTSGHLPHYADDMYAPFKIDEEEFYLRPMNCPFHHMIYKSKPRSYRELPLRLAEYGTVYRHERSGALSGLMRVRGFTQNDSHIYCAMEQAKEEFLRVMKLHEMYYKKLGIKDYYMVLALRDPKNKEKYHGDDAMWELAEKLTREAMNESKIPYKEEIGGAAFYGPKIDFVIQTVSIKEYAISTNQLDLYMGKRFDLEYTDANGKKQTPAIIHRAPLGSHERFVAFLIEHYAGAFPVWLAPVQARILPISTEKHLDYGKKIRAELIANGIRAELDETNETLGKKIRAGELQKIPYLLVVGDKEIKAESVNVRTRGKKETETVKTTDFIEKVKKEIEEKK